ncbi:MAG TPA: DoxX family protein [Candidatus Angelobacter sp.]|nr:DoxX family protein [Candidatus Angelobacter sp.]
MKFLGKFEIFAYTLLRLVFGFLFACHGAQKLFGMFGEHAQLHNPWMLIGGIVEFGAGVLIFLGLFTRIAGFLASGEMAVAYFKFHAMHGLFPIVNQGELAVIYCFVALYIACRGAGKYGIDKS